MLFAIFRWYLFKGGNAMFTTKSLFTDFDRMFDSLYSTYQYDNEYYSDGKLEIDLPGVKKEDVEIECKNQVLHVTAKRKSRDWVLDRKYRLNSKVDVDNIDAKFEDGEGKKFLAISDAMLRCEYNKDRLQEDILNDVRKCFKGCNVCFQHENGQTTIIITWHEQQ
jgi:hypothetical protein